MDGKNTIFGRLVDGFDTLDKLGRIEVNNESHPIDEIRIENVHILVDPFQDETGILPKERENEVEQQSVNVADQHKRKQSVHLSKDFHEVFDL